jgi:hypothetical protein
MGKPGIKASVFSKRSYYFSSSASCLFLNMLKEFFFTCCILMMTKKYTFVYPSSKVVNTSHVPCITDPDQEISFELYDVHDQCDKPQDTQENIISLVLKPQPSKIKERYKPLQLPHILHDFPPKHYKYLPLFDGEPGNPTTEKHIHAFEHFAYFFEIEHDDVCMRAFSQSLQGDAKKWFRHLHPEIISSWEEMKDLFLKFWVRGNLWINSFHNFIP